MEDAQSGIEDLNNGMEDRLPYFHTCLIFSAGLIKCGACSRFCVRGLSCSTNKIAFYKKVCTTNAVLQQKYNTLAISLKLAQLRSFRRILIAENFAIMSDEFRDVRTSFSMFKRVK